LQRLHRLVDIAGARVEPAERVIEIDVGGRRGADRRLLEMVDGTAHVLGGAAALATPAGFRTRREDQPEHAVRVGVVRIERDRFVRRALRLVTPVAAQLERGQLGAQHRRARIGVGCPLQRGQRAGLVTLRLEAAGDEKFVIGIRAGRRRLGRCGRGWRLGQERRRHRESEQSGDKQT
jgi:hypothetical protein